MASVEDPLEKMEQQLTCALCLGVYTDPRTLPCLHSFCQQCLENLPRVTEDGDHISCPTCRHLAELPAEPAGVAGFPVAFHLNQLKDIHSLMKKVSDPQQEVTCDNCNETNAICFCKECCKLFCQECNDVHKKWAPTANHQVTGLDEVGASASQLLPMKQEEIPNCSAHNEPLKIFCETCDDFICRDCTVRIHKDHEYDLVPACHRKSTQVLEIHLAPVKGKMAVINDSLTAITKRENEIKKQEKVLKQRITNLADKTVKAIRQSVDKLNEDTKAVIDGKLQVLTEQKESAKESLRLLEDCSGFVEQSLKVDSPRQVLMSKKQMMERMSQVTRQVNVEKFNPVETADVQLIEDSRIIGKLHHIGDIVSPQLNKRKSPHQLLPLQKRIKLSNSSSRFDPCLDTITPVQVRKFDLLLRNPTGITVNRDGYIIIAFGQSIEIFNKEGKTVSSFDDDFSKKGCDNVSLSYPHSVAITADNYIIVTDWYRIQKITMKGEHVASIGRTSSGRSDPPCGVAVCPSTGHIYVADGSNQRILVLTSSLVLRHSFVVGKGSEKSTPWGVAIDSKGMVYVTDWSNYCIYKFTPAGKLLASFGTKGSGPGQLTSPAGIAIDNDLVFVADQASNHRVSIFTTKGEFVRSFGGHGRGESQFDCPAGMTFDKDGYLYVCDSGNTRLVMY